MRFRSDDDGFITGLRFYKGTQNTGTHVGHLWTNAGTQLAEATFTGETAGGWQEATFSTPVAVTKDTTYVASYHTPVGFYAVDVNYFDIGKYNPPLHGPARRQRRVQVRRRGFPTTTHMAANYWADVVFEQFAAPDTRRRSPPSRPPTARPRRPCDAGHGPLRRAAGRRHDRRHDLHAAQRRQRGGRRRRLRRGHAHGHADAAVRAGELPRYTATVQGGRRPAVDDRAGNAMAEDRTWSFTTATPPPPPPDDRPTCSRERGSARERGTAPAPTPRAPTRPPPTYLDRPGSPRSGTVAVRARLPARRVALRRDHCGVAGAGRSAQRRPRSRAAGIRTLHVHSRASLAHAAAQAIATGDGSRPPPDMHGNRKTSHTRVPAPGPREPVLNIKRQ